MLIVGCTDLLSVLPQFPTLLATWALLIFFFFWSPSILYLKCYIILIYIYLIVNMIVCSLVFFKNRLYFYISFRFIAKSCRKYRVPLYSLHPHTTVSLACQHVPHRSGPLLELMNCIDITLSSRIHSLHQGSLLVLYIPWFWTNVWQVAPITVLHRSISLP